MLIRANIAVARKVWAFASALRIALVLILIFVRGCLSAALGAALDQTIPNCPLWLAQADNFLDECKSHARRFTTTFYPSGGARGEEERHGVWFSTASPGAHFLMGCTTRYDRSLSFLGIYYIAEPSAAVRANDAPILGVSFDGDVVLSVDGHPVTFTAVRPFSTKKVKTRWTNSASTALNCETSVGPDGGYNLMRERIYADLSRFDQDHTLAVSYINDSGKRSEYLEFFPSTVPREIIYAASTRLLVTTSGSILVQRDRLQESCARGDPERVANSPLLLHQLCRLKIN